MSQPDRQYLEHAEDILGFVTQCQAGGIACALAVITDVTGGSARAVGTIVAVSGEGEMAGYVSNGCVDADLRLLALETIAQAQPRQVIYGAGSPYKDLRLPCGGTITIMIDPAPDPAVCRSALDRLATRQATHLVVTRDRGVTGWGAGVAMSGWQGATFIAGLVPRMRLVVAGSGAPTVAVVRLAASMGMPVTLFSPDDTLHSLVAHSGDVAFRHLTTPDVPPPLPLDEWSALLLLFHAHEWETQLLVEGLRGSAFYIGALGSHRTHETRLHALQAAGISPADLRRVNGPIGVIPSARDAQTLAISVLAEMTGSYREKVRGRAGKGVDENLKMPGAA